MKKEQREWGDNMNEEEDFFDKLNEIMRGDEAHNTGVKSSCIKLISKNSMMDVITAYKAMEEFTKNNSKLAEMIGTRIVTFATLGTLMSMINQLVEKQDDEEFARAVMTDIHAVVAAEKWPILSCIHVEEEK